MINTFKFSVNWDKISEFLFPIKIKKHIVFTDGENKINIWDKKYKLIQTITEWSKVTCLSNIKYKEFAAGFNDGRIQLYTLSNDDDKYKCYQEIYNDNYMDPKFPVTCMLYDNNDYRLLIFGNYSKSIFLVYTSSSGSVYSRLNANNLRVINKHKDIVTSLVRINNENNIIASKSLDGEIQIRKIINTERMQFSFDCI